MQNLQQPPAEGKFTLLRDRRFLWLMCAWFSAVMGQQIALITMPWLVLQLGGDGFALGMVITAMELPRAVFIIIGGALVDRHSPRLVLKWSLFICAALVIAVGLAVLSGNLQLWMLYLFAVAIGVINAFTGPSAAALLPETVAAERLQSANAFFMGINQFSLFIGPTLAGLLIVLPGLQANSSPASNTAHGLGLAFILSAACFVTAGFALTRMASGSAGKTARHPSTSNILHSITQGARWAWSDVTLRSLFLYWAAIAFLTAGPIQVGLPLLVKEQMHLGANYFGILISSQGAGSLAGMALLGLLPRWALGRLGVMVFCADGIMGLIIINLGMVHHFTTGAILMFSIGLFSGLVQVRLIVWIQSRIPAHMRGRVMSFLMFMMAVVTPLSTSLVGFLIVYASTRNLYLGAGVLLIAIALFALSSANLRNIKAVENTTSAEEPA
ncbi:MFS transporter [Paraherbaspirillum soli]|uniref:MFS transporter n=1 Tax=Paraherbaspirillum soli TaxID=631222 RepID=A0ABW0MH43_9BURK